MRSIVSFDMDMTLLDHETFEIPDSAMKALEMLRERYVVVLATGRDMDSHYSRNLRELVKPEAIVHTNGTKVTVGDKVIYESFMERELKERLLTFARDHDLAVGVTIGDEDYYIHRERVTEFDEQRWGGVRQALLRSVEAAGYGCAVHVLYRRAGRGRAVGESL